MNEPRGQESPQSPAEVSASGGTAGLWEPGLTQRLRVLLTADPLLALRRGQAKAADEIQHYDTLALAVKAMSLIIERQGLEDELDPAGLTEKLRPFLVAMDREEGVEPDEDRHRRFVEDRLVAALRNDAAGRRPFTHDYTVLDDDGDIEQRQFRLRLLRDEELPNGDIVLRLTEPAINLFVSALEHDIEDAQAAAEAILETQLASGRFGKAEGSAKHARILSLQMGREIRNLLRDTRRDIRRVDWTDYVPAKIDQAYDHIDRRITTEQNIIETARNHRDHLEAGHPDARRLYRIIELVRSCRLQHIKLHHQLMSARDVFLEEQARQSFVPYGTMDLPDLGEDVLEPVLALPAARAEELTGRMMSIMAAPEPPPVLSIADALSWFLQPRRRYSGGRVKVEEPDVAELGPEPSRYPPEVQAAAKERLRSIDEPTLLSEVLGDMVGRPDATDELIECLQLLAQRAYGPDIDRESGEVLRQLPIEAVARNGQTFQIAHLYGDDLELHPLPTDGDENGDDDRN